MSKFIDQIRDEMHVVRIPEKWIKPLSVSESVELISPMSCDEMRRYTIGVKYEFHVECYPSDLRHMKDNIILQLRHDIYGEFELKIFALQRAIFERNEMEANSICRDLITEIRGN